jgi:hypothetical protein
LVDSLDEKGICQGIFCDQIDLAVKELLEFLGNEEEVVGIVAIIHRLTKLMSRADDKANRSRL